eukprot:SM000009S23474  [mRNA]  locus=s9:219165:219731:+ [translate_table: standard]
MELMEMNISPGRGPIDTLLPQTTRVHEEKLTIEEEPLKTSPLLLLTASQETKVHHIHLPMVASGECLGDTGLYEYSSNSSSSGSVRQESPRTVLEVSSSGNANGT